MMALNELSRLEQLRLRKAARDYKALGYRFILSPGMNELPAFLKSFSPAAIAYGENENVVVEVSSTPVLRPAPYLTEMAALVQEQAGWRLELIITNSSVEPKPVENWQEAFINRREIYTRIGEAQTLLENGYHKAALLLLWSAVEATLNLLAHENEIEPQMDTPLHALKSLASLTIISRPEYELISQGFVLYNSISHGLRTSALDINLINQLIEVEMRFLKA